MQTIPESVQKNRSIKQVILTKTLPTLLFILAVAMALFVVVNYIIVLNTQKVERNALVSSIESSIEKSILHGLQTLESVSNQYFVQKALSDPASEERQLLRSYLQSIDFASLSFADISIFDVKSGLFVTNAKEFSLQDFLSQPWTDQVLAKQQSLYEIHADMSIFMVPIKQKNQTLGVLVARLKGLEDAFDFELPEDVAVIILDQKKSIVFTSASNRFPLYSNFTQYALDDNHISERQITDELTVIVLDSNHGYLQMIVRQVLLVAMSLIFIVSASLLSARTAGKTTASTFRHLLQSVRSMDQRDSLMSMSLDEFRSQELVQLQQEFFNLHSKLSETRLSEARFSALINSLNDLLLVIDLDGTLLINNQAFEEFKQHAGIRESNLLSQIFYGKDLDELLNMDRPFKSIEKRYLNASSNESSSFLSVSWSRHRLLSNDGQVTGIIFVGMDTTSSYRLKAEIQLKNAAIDGAESGIFIVEVKRECFNVIYANKGVAKLSGLNHEKFIMPLDQLLYKLTDNDGIFSKIRSAIWLGHSSSETFVRTISDNKKSHIEITLSPATLPEASTSSYYLGLLTDVTEKAMTEELLLEAKARAEESAQMKSAFLANMSHEIRTPINGVIGMLDILRETGLEKKQQGYLDIAQSSAESLLIIINDILDFSKVEAGKLVIEAIDFNLSELLDVFIGSMAHIASRKGLQLVLDAADIEFRHVLGDPGRIRQILTNLTSNAIKFTERGEVFIQGELNDLDDNTVEFIVTIKDTGIGIPKEKQAYLFDPFTQVGGSNTRAQQGTGLGLAIVKQLVESMNGAVWVSSELNKGSVFGFRIILGASEKQVEDVFALDFTNRRLLLIDRIDSNRQALMKRFSNWHIDTYAVASIEQAQQLSDELSSNLDLIIVDRFLLDQQGQHFIASLQRNNAVKVVLMNDTQQRSEKPQDISFKYVAEIARPLTQTQLLSISKILSGTHDTPQMTKQPEVVAESRSEPRKFEVPYRILLVEDNPVNQLITKRYLEDIGLVAVVAEDGQQALDILTRSEGNIELVLMDCQMPVMDGFEATKRIRKGQVGDEYLDIPIIARTANAMKGDKENCLDAGMNDYLSKPMRKFQLMDILDRWIISE